MLGKIAVTCLLIASVALLSGMLLPPGDVPKQLLVVAFWFAVGFTVNAIWQPPTC